MTAVSPAVLSSFELVVEAGKVAEFARAVHSPTTERPHPMHTVCSGHVQNRRELIAEIGLDLKRVLHGEQRWNYTRALRLGERLAATTVLETTGEKQGRAGVMRTATLCTTYSAGDEPVVEERMMLLELSALAGQRPPKRSSGADRTPAATTHLSRELPPLTRTDIVRYAGASGDYNPVHHDELYARELGLPSVFAMGMLPASVLGSLAMELEAPEDVEELEVRFRDRVWPGDVLTYVARDTGPLTWTLEALRGDTCVVGATLTRRDT